MPFDISNFALPGLPTQHTVAPQPTQYSQQVNTISYGDSLDLKTGASNDSLYHNSTADPADAYFLIHHAIATHPKICPARLSMPQVHTTIRINNPKIGSGMFLHRI